MAAVSGPSKAVPWPQVPQLLGYNDKGAGVGEAAPFPRRGH
jgi:hypothetical protein